MKKLNKKCTIFPFVIIKLVGGIVLSSIFCDSSCRIVNKDNVDLNALDCHFIWKIKIQISLFLKSKIFMRGDGKLDHCRVFLLK